MFNQLEAYNCANITSKYSFGLKKYFQKKNQKKVLYEKVLFFRVGWLVGMNDFLR